MKVTKYEAPDSFSSSRKGFLLAKQIARVIRGLIDETR